MVGGGKLYFLRGWSPKGLWRVRCLSGSAPSVIVRFTPVVDTALPTEPLFVLLTGMFQGMIRPTYLLHAALGILLLLVIREALRVPLLEFGDGREYVIQTQAIVFDGTLSVDPVRRAEYWNATSPFDVRLNGTPSSVPTQERVGEQRQFGGHFGALYLDTRRGFRYVHSWVYSLVVAPVYVLLHAAAPPFAEYYAFRVANIALLLVPLLVLWSRHASLSTLAFLALVLASPITPHLQFAHSELFCFACVFLGLLTAPQKGWRFVSPFLIGMGAAQNIPIALFFPLHAWLRWRALGRGELQSMRAVLGNLMVPYALAASLPLGIMGYNWSVFGVPNLIAELGQADLRYLSVRRMVSVYLSPIIGNVWYFPASWFAVLWAFTSGRGKLAVWFVLSTLLVSALSSTTSNIYSAQLSACRYAVWYLASLYALPFVPLVSDVSPRRSAVGRVVMLGAGLVVLLVQIYLGTWQFLLGNWAPFSPMHRATPAVASLYRLTRLDDDIEPLVENLVGSEIRQPHTFSGIYVWNVGSNESVWIVSLRALRQKPRIVVRSSGDLVKDSALREIFDVDAGSSSEFVLSARPGVTVDRHPILGGYKLLWVSSAVEEVRGSVPTVLRP